MQQCPVAWPDCATGLEHYEAISEPLAPVLDDCDLFFSDLPLIHSDVVRDLTVHLPSQLLAFFADMILAIGKQPRGNLLLVLLEVSLSSLGHQLFLKLAEMLQGDPLLSRISALEIQKLAAVSGA